MEGKRGRPQKESTVLVEMIFLILSSFAWVDFITPLLDPEAI